MFSYIALSNGSALQATLRFPLPEIAEDEGEDDNEGR
jgi:hypothetical protein